LSFNRSRTGGRVRGEIDDLGDSKRQTARRTDESPGPSNDRRGERDVADVGRDELVLYAYCRGLQLIAVCSGKPENAGGRVVRGIHPVFRCRSELAQMGCSPLFGPGDHEGDGRLKR
jgi:hypothetical protein